MEQIGQVLAIAVRTARNGPMRETPEAAAVAGAGLEGDLAPAPDRGVTIISSQQWEETKAALTAELPWHTRRANVLVDVARLAPLIGATIRVGDALIEIRGETRPCGLMDELHAGLKAALKPECRGGVHGYVRQGGRIGVGDALYRVADKD